MTNDTLNKNLEKIEMEEEKLEKLVVKEGVEIKSLGKKVQILTGLIAITIIAATAGLLYLNISSSRIYTDAATISGAVSDLTPTVAGTLQETMVNVGDKVDANTIVARVGTELIKTKNGGIVTDVQNNIGKTYNPGQEVVEIVDPSSLRVVAHIDENKGLSDIKVGQSAVFTVDAYGSQKFSGVVDEITPSARQTDIVFNISDKRQINQFDIKIRYNTDQYPELQNGMSAKVWIYKN